ncbi:MAG: hypothetical protein HYZ74_02920 [Elusimicrobia bacterium]|nr:hypothetical protein [Elusimicrobiota bacterium]
MRKRIGDAAVFALAGAALLIVGAKAWGASKAVAAVAALFGVGALLHAVIGCYESPCPACGAAVSVDGAPAYARCPRCQHYASVAEKGLTELPADYFAAAPTFSIPIKPGMALPGVCCDCAQASTRQTTVSAKIEDALAPASLGEGVRKNALLGAGVRPLIDVSVSVPHCGEHAADARIAVERGEGGLTGQAEPQLVVRVKSYACYRAAVGLS